MKSIKPGRGPSFMGGVSSLFAAGFGVLWTFMAASSRTPLIFCGFGVLFVLLGIVQAIYNFKNASSKNRFSSFDVVDSTQEPDPYLSTSQPPQQEGTTAGRFCPYCGAPVEGDFAFCNQCGKKLPQ